MLFVLLASSAFAAPYSPMVGCSINDYPTEVAAVWHLIDNGPYSADAMVSVADNVPSPFIVDAKVSYDISVSFDGSFVILTAWYFLSDHGPVLPLAVKMRRDGKIIGAPNRKNCEGARALAIDFFAHLPNPYTEYTEPTLYRTPD